MLDPRTLAGVSVSRIRTELADMETIPDAVLAAMRRDRRATVRALAEQVTRPKDIPARPDMLVHERKLWERGLRLVAGVDEAGRGPLAGPVYAAAVVLPPECDLPEVQDSKRMKAEDRERILPMIYEAATAVGVASVDADLIDRINILQASRKAMRLAIAELRIEPEYVIVDGNVTPGSPFPEKAIVQGDRTSLSIAAASIVAKVTRDRFMTEMDQLYPGYGFAQHKGYGTPQHHAALRKLGPCPIHRRSFTGVHEASPECSPAYRHMIRAITLSRSLGELREVGVAIADQKDQISDLELQRLRKLYRRTRYRIRRNANP